MKKNTWYPSNILILSGLLFGNAAAFQSGVQQFMGSQLSMKDVEAAWARAGDGKLQHPSEVLIYVTTWDKSPVRKCSAQGWISDALDFGYKVVFYGQNATHYARDGTTIPSRSVEDYGALKGVRDKYDVWPMFLANILDDVTKFAPGAKFVMRMDDDSVLHPANLWRALKALPLSANSDWMIGDCGNDEHHGLWCSGGAGIVISRSLAHKLAEEIPKGVRSLDVCAVVGRNDDDTMGICADAFGANIVNHHGFHPWAPSSLVEAGPLPWYSDWPHLRSWLGGVPMLDNCPAEKFGSFLVVKDWITYHHAGCEVQRGLSDAFQAQRGKPSTDSEQPFCAGVLNSRRFEAEQAIRRCKSGTKEAIQALCKD